MKLLYLKPEEIIKKLNTNFHIIEGFGDLDDSTLYKTRKNGKWTVKQIIGHLYDTQEVWGKRIEKFKGSEGYVLQSYNPEELVEERDYNNVSIKYIIERYRIERTSLIDNLSEDSWFKEGLHPEEGIMRVKDLAETIMLHEIHHIEQIEEIKNTKW